LGAHAILRAMDVLLVEETDAYIHVALRGNLDESWSEAANQKLTSQTVARRKPTILDLSEVGRITSLGIGVLITIERSMRSLDLGLAIIVGKTPVRQVLEMTSIDILIPVRSTRDEALRALRLA